jgi:hypothetical protein
LTAARWSALSVVSEAITPETPQRQMTAPIQSGQVLEARSACDYDCVFSVKVIDRKGSFATVEAHGSTKRVKIRSDDRGEYVYALGKYSMAPIFRAEVAS